jgi:flagellar hook-associated protein 1 FlgK
VLAPDTPAVAVPLVTIAGQDVTGALGGQIGANLALRDTVLPSVQTSLDGVASALASGFAAAGLPLFTNAAGAVPAGPTVGFAQGIQVSAAVRAVPTMLRDGTLPAGLAGSTALINTVLGSVLASGGGSVAAQASSLVAGIAQSAAQASTTLDADKAAQSSLQTRLAADSGVSVDNEMATMVRLQGAYAANAKVLSATNTMWQTLLDSVR